MWLTGFPDERQSLYKIVLPAIRSKCIKIGYELHVVDLYCDHQQLQEYGQLDTAVRLAELRRQNRVGHVVPIVFVDDSLGPPVLPHVMTRQDFDLARTKTPDASKLIEKWYTLDAQKNHYELRNEMMFETTFETQVMQRVKGVVLIRCQNFVRRKGWGLLYEATDKHIFRRAKPNFQLLKTKIV